MTARALLLLLALALVNSANAQDVDGDVGKSARLYYCDHAYLYS